MATKETKVKEWLHEYEAKKKALADVYDLSFELLPVNEAGEVISDAVLSLNNWYEKMEKGLENSRMKKLLDLLEEEGR